MGIYQVMPVTEQIGPPLLCKAAEHGYQRPGQQGRHLEPARAGLQKVKDGLTSLEEVNSVTID